MVFHLPDNAKCAITDGAVRLHLSGAGHLAGRVAVGLRHRCSATGAPSESSGVTRGSSRGSGSGQARRSAEARGGGSAGGVDTEILGAQLRARKQVSTDGLPACAVKCHPPLANQSTLSAPSCRPARRRGSTAPHAALSASLLCVHTGNTGHM